MDRNEAQTRRDLIDPALDAKGWKPHMVKVEVTPGGTDIIDGKPVRRKGRSDYLLCLEIHKGQPPMPIAVLEAKKENLTPSTGLQQAIGYSKKFHVIFSFSTNGHLFTEFAEDNQQIIQAKGMDDFPTPDELKQRFEKHREIKLEQDEAKAIFEKYKGGEAIRRYYQDAAIRAVIEKIAKGDKRILLTLATGTGKTFIAKQLLWKLAQAGQIRRALFLVDRDELRSQGITNLQGIFGDDAQEITTANPKTNAKILVGTYQTLNVSGEDKEPKFWKENFPENYFSHIIIDECHRSAWGNWSIILTDNPDAIQVGLTATPRTIKGGKDGEEGKEKDKDITAHNIKYFGEPVYEYTIADGQADGYLSACEVIKRFPSIDSKTLTKDEIAEKSAYYANTQEPAKLEDIEETYNSPNFEKKLLLADRVKAMTEDLFAFFLKTGGPHQKSIIFCASEAHAQDVSIAIHNLYANWCQKNGVTPKEMYSFRCTNSETNPSPKALIAELRGSKNSHYVATTVELLSTGVDVPNLNNVVFFKYLNSPISFYQMVGRGTRIGEPQGSKMMFRIYDYTNATRLFGEDFISRPAPVGEGGGEPPTPPRKTIKVGNDKFIVEIQDKGVSILVEEDGKDVLIPYEQYKEKLATAVAESVEDLEKLRVSWINPISRRELVDRLPGGESAIRLVRELEEEQECDLYDVLAKLGFGYMPKTRLERSGAFSFRNKQWLKEYPEKTQKVLQAIAMQFSKGGIEELETENLFDVHEIIQSGGFEALLNLPFEPRYFIEETKLRLLA